MALELSLERAKELAKELEDDQARAKKKEEEARTRRMEELRRRRMTKWERQWEDLPKRQAAAALAWLAGWYVAGRYGGVGSLYFIASGFIMMFTVGLGDTKKEKGFTTSAYSVFNDGCTAMEGSLSAEQIEGELRNRGRPGPRIAPGPVLIDRGTSKPNPGAAMDPARLRELIKKARRNDQCPCQSGLKFKKCCANAKESDDDAYSD